MVRRIEIDISCLDDYSPKHHKIDILRSLLKKYEGLKVLAIASTNKIFIMYKDTRDRMVEKTLMKKRNEEIEKAAEEIARRFEKRQKKEVIVIILKGRYGVAIAWAVRREMA